MNMINGSTILSPRISEIILRHLLLEDGTESAISDKS